MITLEQQKAHRTCPQCGYVENPSDLRIDFYVAGEKHWLGSFHLSCGTSWGGGALKGIPSDPNCRQTAAKP